MKKYSAIILVVSAIFSLGTKSLAVPSDGTTSTALLTEAKGTVYKRSFIDWSKQQWGDPETARKGDVLQEGMQVGTGDKSWAQVAWQHVTCRAWANSVYAVAPNQRLVYLQNGEMLFHLDKNRKDKDNYCIWTNLLQARVRGTTVLVQATAENSKLTVLEGTVDVLNKLDHSVVRIKPGVVYTIQAKAGQLPTNISSRVNTINNVDAIQRALNAPAIATDANANKITGIAPAVTEIAQATKPPIPGSVSTVETIPQQLTNIISAKQVAIPLFNDIKSTTDIQVANVDALLAHPLVVGLESELSSLSLVKESLQSLPAAFHEGVLSGDAAVPLRSLSTAATDTPIISSAAEILRVPTRSSYDLGPLVPSVIHVSPVTVALFPPSAIIGSAAAINNAAVGERSGSLRIDQGGHKVFSLQDPLFRLPVLQALESPQLPGGANLPGATSGPGGSLVINNNVLVSRSLGVVGLTPSLSSSIVNSSLTNSSIVNSAIINGSASGLAGALTNGLNNTVLVRGANGSLVTIQLSGVTGLVGNTVTGVGGVVTSVGGTVSTLGSTLGGTLGGTVGSVGATVGGLGNTVSGLGSSLNGTLNNTLNGLLKH
jgi:hypothetical protein